MFIPVARKRSVIASLSPADTARRILVSWSVIRGPTILSSSSEVDISIRRNACSFHNLLNAVSAQVGDRHRILVDS